MLRVSGRFEFSIEGSSYRESTVVLFSMHYFEGSRTGVQLGSGLTLSIKNVGKEKIGLKAFFYLSIFASNELTVWLFSVTCDGFQVDTITKGNSFSNNFVSVTLCWHKENLADPGWWSIF